MDLERCLRSEVLGWDLLETCSPGRLLDKEEMMINYYYNNDGHDVNGLQNNTNI